MNELESYRKHVERLQKALEINQLIAGELHLRPLLQQIMRTTKALMEAELCSLFLVDDERGDLVFYVNSGEEGAELLESGRLPMGSGIAGWCAEHGKSVCLADVYADPRFNAEFDRQTGFRTRNMICAPLMVHGRLIGVSQVINHLDGEFGKPDEQLMEAIVQMVAIAIDNARTHERLVEQEVRQHDLDMAKSIQSSFLPESAPAVPDYEVAFHVTSAYEVGGDFYDAVRLGDGRTAYLLGDISGKGVSAAMLMSSIMRDIHAELTTGGIAGEILGRFNTSLCRTARNGMFVSLILLILNPETGEIEMANAGHPSPVLMRQGGPEPHGAASGPPAGIITDVRYECDVLSLAGGEMLLLYSDGIIEARNSMRRMVRERGLYEWLKQAPQAPRPCIDYLLDQIRQHIGQEQQADDITLLALYRQL